MIFKIRFGKWKVVLTVAPVTQVAGVNSTLPNGKHILMWDFDDVTFERVKTALDIIQVLEDLPTIYILSTGRPNAYIAYCFCAVPWEEAVRIVASTKFTCPKFFKWSVYRGYFTLRIGPKYMRKPKLVYKLYSNVPPTATPWQLHNFVKYLIFEQGYKNRYVVIPRGT